MGLDGIVLEQRRIITESAGRHVNIEYSPQLVFIMCCCYCYFPLVSIES